MKTIVVTGAAGGIGKATLSTLYGPDVKLVCIDASSDRLACVLKDMESLDGICKGVVSDLANRQECKSIVDEIEGTIVGFAHLAGVFEKDDDYPVKTYERAIQNNLTNGYHLAGLIAKKMDVTQNSSMVFISSLAFNRGSPK